MQYDEKPKLVKKKYKRGEPHTHPTVDDWDKEVPKYPVPHEGCATLPENFKHSVETFSSRPCMGYRVLKGHIRKKVEVEGEVKLWDVPEFEANVRWLTYQQVWDKVVKVGDGLMKLVGLKKNDTICIYENTRYEWFLAAHGAWRHGLVLTTAYANLGIDNLIYSLNKTKVSAMFMNRANIAAVMKEADKVPALKYLIYFEEPLEKEPVPKSDRFEIISFSELEKLGEKNVIKEEDITKPDREDTCVIMFTSGSTGVPKGVVVRHFNLCAGVWAARKQLKFREETVFLSYLPLAHILEMEAECCALFVGASLAFGTPKTLVDRQAMPCGDIAAYKPTVMLGVPRVWDTVKKRVFEMVSSFGMIKSWLFNTGFAAKKKALKEGGSVWLWNFILFNKFKQRFGGRLQLLATGAAPLSKSSHEFMAAVFDVPFLQGYGLTEVSGAATGQGGWEFKTGDCGYPIVPALVKLIDCPSMNYMVNGDKEQGEVCISGPIVTGGYYEEPEKTAESFKKGEDGRMWFHTGDIGEWNPDGSLKIIDRIKNIIKLSGGEYVAVVNLEADYGADCPFIEPNGIYVHADPTRDYLLAVIRLMPSYALDWAEKNNKKKDLKILCDDEDVKKLIMEDLKKIATEKKYKKFETIRDILIVTEKWLPENGLMTASNKLRRRPLADKYKEKMEEMFDRIDGKKIGKKDEKKKKKMKEGEKKKEEEEEEEIEVEDNQV